MCSKLKRYSSCDLSKLQARKHTLNCHRMKPALFSGNFEKYPIVKLFETIFALKKSYDLLYHAPLFQFFVKSKRRLF